MIALFIIIYVGAIWLVYAKLKIQPTPVNIAVAASIGFLAVGLIFVLWQFSAPVSSRLVVNRYTIQIVPQVSGPITKIHAEPNVPLAKGKDLLFEIQADTYQYAVNELDASLEAAKKNREQVEAGIKVAEASITEAEANLESARVELAMDQEAAERNPDAISKLELTQLIHKKAAADAALARSRAAKQQTEAQLRAADSTIESIQAKLDTARFNLSQCKVYAPADGFVTNWQVREGTMAVPLPLAPLGTFIDTSRVSIVAAFSQNVLKNVKAGDRADFAFKTRPGEISTGTVDAIIAATGEGQFITSGQLLSAADVGSSGQLAVKLQLDDEQFANSLPMGATGTVVIYTDSGKPFHVISKVSARMKAWLYYLIPL
jgi:multidrug resistance efflux pump